jgi:hypothetical protein
MAIRRPSIFSPEWLVQDFPFSIDSTEERRYTQVKWDGGVFTRQNETFDYSNPPYTNSEQRGGPVVAQIDYSIVGTVITIEDWSTTWRDELPLRVGINNIVNCRYPYYKNWVVRVAKDTEAYAFWASEYFFPYTNEVSSESYLYFTVESAYMHI